MNKAVCQFGKTYIFLSVLHLSFPKILVQCSRNPIEIHCHKITFLAVSLNFIRLYPAVFYFLFQRYHTLGTVVYLSMSADSTCRGIRSPRDGPTVMELTKGKAIIVLLMQACT